MYQYSSQVNKNTQEESSENRQYGSTLMKKKSSEYYSQQQKMNIQPNYASSINSINTPSLRQSDLKGSKNYYSGSTVNQKQPSQGYTSQYKDDLNKNTTSQLPNSSYNNPSSTYKMESAVFTQETPGLQHKSETKNSSTLKQSQSLRNQYEDDRSYQSSKYQKQSSATYEMNEREEEKDNKESSIKQYLQNMTPQQNDNNTFNQSYYSKKDSFKVQSNQNYDYNQNNVLFNNNTDQTPTMNEISRVQQEQQSQLSSKYSNQHQLPTNSRTFNNNNLFTKSNSLSEQQQKNNDYITASRLDPQNDSFKFQFKSNSSNNQNNLFALNNNTDDLQCQTPTINQMSRVEPQQQLQLSSMHQTQSPSNSRITSNNLFTKNQFLKRIFSNDSNEEYETLTHSKQKAKIFQNTPTLTDVTKKSYEKQNDNSPVRYESKSYKSKQCKQPESQDYMDLASHIELRYSKVRDNKDETQTDDINQNMVMSNLKKKLFELNSTIEENQLDSKLLNFYSEYSLLKQQPEVYDQNMIKNKLEQTKLCKSRLEEKVKRQNQNSITHYNYDLALLSLHSYYLDQGFTNVFLDDVSHTQDQEDFEKPNTVERIQQQIVSSGQVQNLKYMELRFQDNQEINYDKISTDSQLQNDMLQKVKQAVADSLDIALDRVIILNVKKGSVIIELTVKDADDLSLKCTQSFKKLGLAEPQIEIKTLLDYFTLNFKLFDPRFNQKWNINSTQKLTRGKLFFKSTNRYEKQPYNLPKGYLGFAINVSQQLEKDQKWIGEDDDAWIVLYHGTNKGVNEILNDKIKPGPSNFYGGCECRITGEKIVAGSNTNTYLADNVDSNGCDKFARPITICGKNYKIIFQCRVNPLAVRSPVRFPTYYTVEDSKFDVKENIRPYRLLIKQV